MAYSAARKLSGRPEVLASYARVGVPAHRLPPLAVVLLAGAAGVLAGLWWRPLGMAAALMAQPSNRTALLEGTLRCPENLPPEQVTARVIAAESGANLASIAYHFGSKEELITAALIEGLDRWLIQISEALDEVRDSPAQTRFAQAGRAVERTQCRHLGLARNYVVALARATHDDTVRELLANGFHRSRPQLAAVLGLGDDDQGHDAAGLVLALFHGLLIQALLDPSLALTGDRMTRAQARLRLHLPT